MNNMVEIVELIYKYESHGEEDMLTNALNGINLSVEKGSFTAIIGENGSGKSTIAKCINGLFWPTEGPHQLSGGQKQRIAIAGAIAMEPDCIIFDEPTAMLDPQGREEVMEIIHELNKKGITVVLITHMMEEAALADKIFIVDKGEVVFEGSPKEAFSNKEMIESLKLALPFEVELAHRLNEKGIKIPTSILTEEELIEEIKGVKGI